MTHTFIAKLHREEPYPGIQKVMLELIRDDDVVELVEGQEFYTVTMQVDPFKDA